MNVTKIGSGNKKICFIHGWMHSASAYYEISEKLSKELGVEVHILESPSFGETKPITYKKMLDTHGIMARDIIAKEKYDLIIGHSMGGALIIRAIEDMDFEKIPKVILCSPAYAGINVFKPYAHTPRITALIFEIIKNLPKKLRFKILKRLSSFCVEDVDLIDDVLVAGMVKADGVGGFILHKELAFDKRRIATTKNFVNTMVIYCDMDKIITKERIDLLMKDGDISNLIVMNNLGHTPLIEATDEFYEIIKEFYAS